MNGPHLVQVTSGFRWSLQKFRGSSICQGTLCRIKIALSTGTDSIAEDARLGVNVGVCEVRRGHNVRRVRSTSSSTVIFPAVYCVPSARVSAAVVISVVSSAVSSILWRSSKDRGFLGIASLPSVH